MNSMKKTGRPEAFSKKAKGIDYVMRISYDNFNTPAKLDGMIRFCRKAGIREVQLVPVDSTSGDLSVFPPRKIIGPRCRQLTAINRKLRKNGIKPGYGVMRTFMATSVTGKDYIGFKQPRVDIQGVKSHLHPCSLDKIYLDYIKFFYGSLAGTAPETMLVDDDFRYECLQMGITCFCPLHLREFRRRYGHKLDREALKTVLEKAEPSGIKNDWMEFKRVLLVEFARDLRETVHNVNPDIRMGLMLTSTEISALEGRDHRELVEAFAGDLRPLVRPGQGCYSDENRLMILKGLTDTVYQSHLMSEDTEIQAEIDFYPHQVFNKSAHFGFDFQAKANLACGVRKINIWPFGRNHEVSEKHPYADYMQKTNGTLNRIIRAMPADARMRGVQFIYSQKAARLRSQREQNVRMYMSPIPELLWRLGVSYTFEDSPVAILTKDSFPMSREIAEDILNTRNVLMDYEALELLNDMGLKQVSGLKNAGLLLAEDRVEELISADTRNGTAAGCSVSTGKAGRFVRWKIAAGSSWRPLSLFRGINRAGKLPGMLAREKNGRRMVVAACRLDHNGYWANHVKQVQVQALLEWLNGGALPAVVRDAPDVCPVLLEDAAAGMRVLSLINVSTACADGITVEVAAPLPANAYEVLLMDDEGRCMKPAKGAVSTRRGSLRIRISDAFRIFPYQVRVLFIKGVTT